MGDAAKPLFDTSYTSELVCPHCGHEQSDSWEISGDTGECSECEETFGIERFPEMTYSTFIPEPPPPKPVAPPPDLSFLIGEPDGELRVGSVGVYGTTLGVWEEDVDESLSRVMLGVLARLYRRGFQLDRDPDTLEHYPTLANGRWGGKRRDLEVLVSLTGRHLEVKFFQSLNLEPSRAAQKNGGRYQSDPYKWMPRRMQLECVTELANLVRQLHLDYGYSLSEKRGLNRALPLLLAVRGAVDGSWSRGQTPLERFHDSWGANRFECDESGFMTEKAYTSGYPGRGLDRDDVLMHTGDIRYFYSSGRLMRGVVYPEPNGQWAVAYAGKIRNFQGHELFSDPTMAPRRFVPKQVERLEHETKKALEKKNYQRVASISRALMLAAAKAAGKKT